jgi:undecaprenyl diphosphate synthase
MDEKQLPKHIAIIMDGNGRWATSKKLPRQFGHKAGVEATDRVLESLVNHNIEFATLYTFSTENWNRPSDEVSGLFELFIKSLGKYIDKIDSNNVRLIHTGRTCHFSEKVKKALDDAVLRTSKNTGMTLCLAIDYGGRQEIIDAVRSMAEEGCDLSNVTEKMMDSHLYVPNMPPVDLVIRSAGEQRLSNFLIWECAYAEYYYSPTLWPDFGDEEISKALESYAERKRKFGRVEGC